MKKLFLIILCIITFSLSYGQDDSNENDSYTDLGADIVSSYVWRGLATDATPNIQGWGEFGIIGLSAGVWASTNFTGSFAETDIYLGYSYKNFGLMLTDYIAGWDDVFNFKTEETVHAAEIGLSYTISENIPLQFLGTVLFYGADKKIDSYNAAGNAVLSDKNNFSTYFELQYTLTHNETDIIFTSGFVTHESYFYNTEKFAFINIGAGIHKTIKITEDFSLPINFSLIANPSAEALYTVFGISF